MTKNLLDELHEGGYRTIEDVVAKQEAEAVAAHAAVIDAAARYEAALADRQMAVWRLRHGLAEYSLQRIADLLGLSKQAVANISDRSKAPKALWASMQPRTQSESPRRRTPAS
jgi:DNA-directed RNA polymerase sigma subunit (sigma70/sigma32)